MPASISHSLSVLLLPGTEADSTWQLWHAGISPVCLLHFAWTQTQSWELYYMVILSYFLKNLHAVLVWLYSTFLPAGIKVLFLEKGRKGDWGMEEERQVDQLCGLGWSGIQILLPLPLLVGVTGVSHPTQLKTVLCLWQSLSPIRPAVLKLAL